MNDDRRTETGGGRSRRAWYADLAWLPGTGVLPDVLIEADGDRFSGVAPRTRRGATPPGTIRLPGLTLPGFANSHSHAFHRALRGITQAGKGSFWTWRERMYEVGASLTPDSYRALATAVFAEMALAGITCVGEFHYLHHGPGGTPYSDANEMSRAMLDAAAAAGLRITLLDTCYLSGGLDSSGAALPLSGTQLRFGDGTAQRWAERMTDLGGDSRGVLGPAARIGAAIHSVRAVPPDQMRPVVCFAQRIGAPLHVHLSEQVAENQACLEAYRMTPSAVLYDAGALGPRTSVVHATHLTSQDIELLGGSETFACLCPTTEADLADGIGPFRALAQAGCRLTVGSDSQAVVDLLEETRRIELYQRLATGRRGHFTADALGTALTWDGHASLGWPDAGEIAPGSLADLVTIDLGSPRLAGLRAGADGTALETALFAATAADVRNVVIGGRDIVADGRHLLIDDVPGALRSAVGAVVRA